MNGRPAALLACVVAWLAARAATAGIVMTMEPAAPGSPDVVVRWAADASSTGPYTLLRREVAAGSTIAGSLPLVPATHAYVTGISGNELLLAGEASSPLLATVRVYQLVDSSGGCSNVGYVVKRGSVQPFFSQEIPDDVLALPGLHPYRTARQLLDHFPTMRRVQVRRDDCLVQYLVRDAGGAISGLDFVVRGDSVVECYGSDWYDSTIVGASAPTSPTTLSNERARQCARKSMLAALPYGTSLEPLELFCGERDVDWFDANGDGWPDTCPAGLHSPLETATLTLQAAPLGMPSVAGFGFAVNDIIGTLFFFFDLDRFAPGSGLFMDWQPTLGPEQDVVVDDTGDDPACRCVDSDGDGMDDCLELLDGTDPANPTSVGPDADRDGVPDEVDACPTVADAAQANGDADAFGDACDPCPADATNACADPDDDGFVFGEDNCPDEPNDQTNGDHDLPGDACDLCPLISDPQLDQDMDGLGDFCDPCPFSIDADMDDVCDDLDNCPMLTNPRQSDMDFDGVGDDCDCTIGFDPDMREPAEVSDLDVRFPVAGTQFLRLLTWRDPRPLDRVTATFDVVSGRLADLWETRSLDGAECLATGLGEAQYVDAFSAGSRWYLVRGSNFCGRGTFGTSAGPVNARALLDDDATNPCP